MLEAIISGFITWSAANPDALSRGMAAYKAGPSVDTTRFEAFADMSQQILRCYHPTARYRDAKLVEAPWREQHQYNATSSSVIEIRYVGLSNATYSMVVGLVGRNGEVRTTVVSDSAKIRASARCRLEDWTAVESNRNVKEPK